MSKPIRLLALATSLIAVAACTGGAAPASSTPPSAAPSAVASGSPGASPGSFGEIEHATGATDILLRYENGGGFVAPGFLATEAPIFTLYGDGTVVFRNPSGEFPQPIGSVSPQNPFRTVKLSEDDIQSVLAYALGDGGLGVARATYENNQVADAPTTMFTIDAGGIKKTVSVYALGMDVQGQADGPARTAFQALADRLGDFDKGGSVSTDVYQPTAYRGILMDGSTAPDQIAWPWTDLTPSDFAFPADANAFQLAKHVLTQAQVDATGLKDVQGGFQGLPIASPDGSKVYSLSVRPLLPDETE